MFKHSRREKSRRRLTVAMGALLLIMATLSSPLAAHESENDGHIPANVNYGFEVIGRDVLEGVTDGKYTDVWSHDGYAYIGTFQEPECTTAGVFVVDIAQAVENYPETTGATVAEIKSAEDTRINDVKLVEIGDMDVLITTEEPCGEFDEEGIQSGNGGISLWDVTNPLVPVDLTRNFEDFGGVHNTFPWTSADGGTYLIGVADTFDFVDVPIYDISDPTDPDLVALTGVLDWFEAGLINEDQLETGNFDALLNHDVWVENIDGRDIAVVSYWDLGFATLDVTDPSNPQFLGDSTYPETDPLGRPYEGNAHAAVFGAGGDIIVAGDEDFDPAVVGLIFAGEFYETSLASFPDEVTIEPLAEKDIVWSGGVGCTAGEIPASTAANQVALIQRGTCAFSTKAMSAAEAGYVGYIVANDEERGNAVLTMGADASGDDVTIPGIFVGYDTGEIMKGGGEITEFSASFDGWGYLRVLNNKNDPEVVPDRSMGPTPTISVPYLHEMGYYAPAETLEEPKPVCHEMVVQDTENSLYRSRKSYGGKKNEAVVTVDLITLPADVVVSEPRIQILRESGWTFIEDEEVEVEVVEQAVTFDPALDGVLAVHVTGLEGDFSEAEICRTVSFTEFGDLTMHNVEQDPTTIDVDPTFDGGPRFFVSWYSLGMRAVEYRPGHFHSNARGEGSYSWNVHEVGRFIADDGSNFWGVHVDEVEIKGETQQVILASDRNTGLWVFTFGCENRADVEGPFYCDDTEGEAVDVCHDMVNIDTENSLYRYRQTYGGRADEGVVTVNEIRIPDDVEIDRLEVQIHRESGWSYADATVDGTTLRFDPALEDVLAVHVRNLTGDFSKAEVCLRRP